MLVDTLVTVVDINQFALEMGLCGTHPAAPPPTAAILSEDNGKPPVGGEARPLCELLVEQVILTYLGTILIDLPRYHPD